MNLTKLQLFEQMCKHAAKESGLQDLFEFMIESMLLPNATSFNRKSQKQGKRLPSRLHLQSWP